MILDKNVDNLKPISKVVNRTLKTAKLIDPFWDRWLVHGLDVNDLNQVRPNLQDLKLWRESWKSYAQKKEIKASELEKTGQVEESEMLYRQVSLYYNLNYWIDPKFSDDKKFWYKICLTFIKKADSLSKIKTLYRSVWIDDCNCFGRIRITDKPKGCILIINPIDSSKEELYKYELDFVNAGFITISFDGPGQGESFLANRVFGTKVKWEKFINQLIEYSKEFFPDLPKFLFGTSLGASWALYGSSHREIKKTVAVSPAVDLRNMNMPVYFMERMNCSVNLESQEIPIPYFHEIKYHSPVLLFHGKKDVMVPSQEMYKLYNQISSEKKLIQYEEEGHCCNNQLGQIRQQAIEWFSQSIV